MNKKVTFIVQAGIIAALYVVLTFLANAMGLASGAIQFRLSEALTILPYFTTAAIPGLWIGCILANFLTGCALYDIIFGSLATLLGAVFSYLLRKNKWLVPIPPIVANVLIVPWVLRFVYEVPDAIWYLMLTVGIGEVVCCGVLGMLLLFALEKRRAQVFPGNV
ncbi:MAG: QueT transporter family protein [Lachnospiraceae bacterium]|nr:QueT transporter family protein [Lachnospiraceae bacterium]